MLKRVDETGHAAMLKDIATISGLKLDIGGKPFLGPINCTLPKTGCTIILGPNGAGKSILMRLMHGLVAPMQGSIVWHGGASPLRQAMVFQKPVLLRRSVAANMDYVLKGADRVARRTEFLEMVGLADRAHQAARLLSGGEQQRLALARALATRPDVLFLDEPTSSLDPASVAMIEQIVGNAVLKGVKVIMVTHDIGQARRLANDVLFLHRGQLVEQAPNHRFFDFPQAGAAKAFLAGEIVL